MIEFFLCGFGGSIAGYWVAFACWRHRHRWVILSTHYTAPLDLENRSIKCGGTNAEEVWRRAIEGTSNIYLQCQSCGIIETRSVFGKLQTGHDDAEIKTLRRMAGIE